MLDIPEETAEAIVAAQTDVPPRAEPATSRLRLGIGGRMALGLAAVAAVIIWGHFLATRTTRIAVEAVRSMQTEHEPRAQRASAVVESLVAYDRAVIEYLQSGRSAELGTITAAGDALQAAVLTYFQSASPRGTGAQLLPQLTSHMEHGRDLAKHAAERAAWLEQRYAALDHVQQRINSAGGAGLAINGTQVVANRSLAELASAINAVRGITADDPIR